MGLGGAADYGDDHFTCFQFDYDWRRDNVENARRLSVFITEKRAHVQAQYKRRYGIDQADVKFDIVAHSMGALLMRYFLMYGGEDLPADGQLLAVTWAGVSAWAAGDGTVLRSSALLDERAGGAYRPNVDTPIAFRQVLFWLLEDKRWRD